MRSYYLRAILLMFMLLNLPGINRTWAQVSSYIFSQSIKPFPNSGNGEQMGDANNAGHRMFLDPAFPQGSTTATHGPGYPIGFDFVYNNIVYDRFGVMNNGWICLGQSVYGDHAVDIGQIQFSPLEAFGPQNDTLRARIAAFDAYLLGNGTSSSLTYELQSDTVNYTLIIKWKKYKIYQASGTNNTDINFEIRLNSVDHSIDIRYGNMMVSNYNSFTPCNVGISGLTRSDFNNRKTPVSKDWNATTAGSSFSDDCAVQSTSIMPVLGLNFHYAPSLCPPVPMILENYVTNTEIQLSWPAAISAGAQYEYVLNALPASPPGGTITSNTNAIFENLTPSSTYYFHIRVKCSGTLNSNWLNYPVKTRCNPVALPYFEDFESTSIPQLPGCMTSLNLNPESQTWQTQEKVGMNSANGVLIPYESFLSNDDYLFLPPFELEEDSLYMLSFDYSTFNYDSLWIYAGSYPHRDSMEEIGIVTTTSEAGFAERYLFYTPGEDGQYYVAIRSKHADVVVDNIRFNQYNCTIPENIQVVENEVNHLVLRWDSLEVPGISYEYAFLTTQAYPPYGINTTTEDTLLMTTLEPGNTYHFYLRSTCGGNIVSPWTHFEFESRTNIDECEDAVVLEVNDQPDCDAFLFSTRGATSSGMATGTCIGVPDDDVWLKFTATHRSHRIQVRNFCTSLGGGGTEPNRSTTTQACAPLIVELRGGSCGENFMSCVEIPDNITKIFEPHDLIPGQEYFIRVFGQDSLLKGHLFSICVGTFPTETNNTCGAALLVPVSATTCPTNNQRNIGGANAVNTPVSNCDSAPYYDLWYKFVTTSTKHIVEASFSDNGNGVLDVFDGNCNALVPIACSNNTTVGSEQVTLTGLSIGDTIWIRVYDAGNVGAVMKVSICIRIPSLNDECINATNIPVVSGRTLTGAINANSFTASGNLACSAHFADDDLWYKFTAIHDTHLIVSIPIAPNAMTVPVIEAFSGDCTSSSLGCSSTGDYLWTGLMPGNVYYFKVYSSSNITGRGNFRVGVTIPPSNIYCSNSIPIPVSTGVVCAESSNVTTIGAGVKNEVWFSFVPNTSTLTLLTEGDTTPNMAIYEACNGLFLTSAPYYKNYIPGEEYIIHAYTPVFPNLNYQYFQGSFNMCFVPPPSNDEYAGAIPVETQNKCSTTYHGSTHGATPSIETGTCHQDVYDTWYKFTATSSVHRIYLEPDSGYYSIIGQVYKGNDLDQPIACFNDGIGSNVAVTMLEGLEEDSTYLIRVALPGSSSQTGEFTLCISSPPVNDHCLYATPALIGTTTGCNNSFVGTTINATQSMGRQNVWYIFTAQSKYITIVVTPLDAGFDPGIKLWNDDNGITLDDCVFTLDETLNEAHFDYQPEIFSFDQLVIGQTYYVEIYRDENKAVDGNFEICFFNPEKTMTVYGATSETYPFDTVVSAGTWNQPVTKVTLLMSGTSSAKALNKIVFDATGTTDMSDVLSASVFIDPKVWGFHNSTIPRYMPFGDTGEGLSEYPNAVKFGETIYNPGPHLAFEGEFFLPGDESTTGSDNYPRYIYLVFEVACDADINHEIRAICTYVTIDHDSIATILGNTEPLAIAPLDSYDTRQDGLWSNGETWMCGTVPPDNPALSPVNIYHHIDLHDTVTVGRVNIYFQQSLSMTDGAMMTMGASSYGTNTGLSNNLLECREGSLLLDDAQLVINGGLDFGTSGGEMEGNGICCSYGQGYYTLTVNDSILTRDSAFVSVDYFPFCIVDGEVVEDLSREEPGRSASKLIYELLPVFQITTVKTDLLLTDDREVFAEMNLDHTHLAKIIERKSRHIAIEIPTKNGKETLFELELIPDPYSQTRILTAPSMQEIDLPKGVHYRGKLKGESKSSVCISFFENEIIGTFSIPGKGNFNLGKAGNADTYIAYNDVQTKLGKNFTCDVIDDGKPYTREQLFFDHHESSQDNRLTGDCIRIYLEIDLDIVAQKGGVTPAANYVFALFNQVAALYDAEEIPIALSEIILWTANSPYTQTSTNAMLNHFKLLRPSFNGELGLLLNYKFAAGLAQFDGLCQVEQKLSLGYAGIFSSFANLPDYSWSVEVVAHELGHLFGSRHTHACVWNGNQTVIDGCSTAEGNCENNGTIPANGGTIMSYCHLTEAGINFANGFGLQPGNVMRYVVANATCTESCAPPACDNNEVIITIDTDSHPEETKWRIEDADGNVLFKGGPYVISNHLYSKTMCLPDGCYRLIITDQLHTRPGGTLIIKDSKITIDGVDGINPVQFNDFAIHNANIYTENADISILDPGIFLYGTDEHLDQVLDGKLTFGGGDDTGSETGFGLQLGPGNGTGIMILDSLIIDGGMASQNRGVLCGNNFAGVKNIWIRQGAEFQGGLAITHNFRNDGLYTGRQNRNLSFCGKMNIGHHFANTTHLNRLYGTGLIRASDTDPVPSSQQGNQINMLRLDNTHSGLQLEMPLGVKNTMRLLHGKVFTTDSMLLTLGDSTSVGVISTDIANTQWWYDNPFEGGFALYNGGTIAGPFRRWFMDSTTTVEKSLMPISHGNIWRTVGLDFQDTSPGHVTVRFHNMQPGIIGLPLTNEQGTNIGYVSQSGYWNVESVGTSGVYDITVRASGFTSDGFETFQNAGARLIKRPVNGPWQLSGSTTTIGPTNLQEVKAEGLSGFSDFAIGLSCGNVVTTGIDNTVGSLRHVLANCTSNGDTIKFDSSLSLIIISTDTILINKNVTVYVPDLDSMVIEGTGVHSMLKVATPNVVKMIGITLETGNAMDGKAIVNEGNLTLRRVTIRDNGNGNSVILNRGTLIVMENVLIGTQ